VTIQTGEASSEVIAKTIPVPDGPNEMPFIQAEHFTFQALVEGLSRQGDRQ
jgi:hypothetical protein